jgi:hypothetical protein
LPIDPGAATIHTMTASETFREILARRLSRRDFLRQTAASAAAIYLPQINTPLRAKPPGPGAKLSFAPIPPSVGDRIQVADGHEASIFLSWGDPVLPGAPAFDPDHLSAAAQAMQFGYNCDFVGFLPLPRGGTSSTHGLLVVNHEYTNPELMFPDYTVKTLTKEQADLQLAAHGMTVVEVECTRERGWRLVEGSPYARRITGTTRCLITGPAAGYHLLQTSDDPSGRWVTGTLSNCSAGKTPWGTLLVGEENWHLYFGNRDKIRDEGVGAIHARYAIPREISGFGFERFYDRFDVAKNLKEPFRYGWIVEVDPYDPTWVPRKRTSLGRFRHEGASGALSADGRMVLYSGDDIPFEYIYKFVTEAAVDPANREVNRDLLDRGTLYVARFGHEGSGAWVPLVQGVGPLIPRNGFENQADVLAKTCLAADFLGATKMDRPEDIKVSPRTGTVYCALTHNPLRGTEGYIGPYGPNPRPRNVHGHVIEIREQDGDHGGLFFDWDIFLLCGDPDDASSYYAGFPKDRVSAISCPDNLTFDIDANLWIATDGQPGTLGSNDALYAVPVDGPERGYVRRFFSGVRGSEISSPEFTPDNRTLFVSVQHPGEGTTLAAPSSRWPGGTIPRPSVVLIQERTGGRVGSPRSTNASAEGTTS